MRGEADGQGAYHLRFLPHERRVELFDQALSGVDGLDTPFTLDIILMDSLIDVRIDGRRCLINRCPELNGDFAILYAHCSSVIYDSIEVTDIAPHP